MGLRVEGRSTGSLRRRDGERLNHEGNETREEAYTAGTSITAPSREPGKRQFGVRDVHRLRAVYLFPILCFLARV